MKKNRYSDEQIIKILREADKSPVLEVAKKYGISEQRSETVALDRWTDAPTAIGKARLMLPARFAVQVIEWSFARL